MTNYRVARRYARALITLAEEKDLLKVVADDLQRLRTTAAASRELVLFLASPVINKDKKQKALKELFGKKVNPLTLQFLMLLVSKGREQLLLQIIEQFGIVIDEKLGIIRVEIASTVSLDEKQEKKLEGHLEEYTAKKVVARYSLDKELKGGFIARMGDTVFDASVKRQLEILKQSFIEGKNSDN